MSMFAALETRLSFADCIIRQLCFSTEELNPFQPYPYFNLLWRRQTGFSAVFLKAELKKAFSEADFTVLKYKFRELSEISESFRYDGMIRFFPRKDFGKQYEYDEEKMEQVETSEMFISER